MKPLFNTKVLTSRNQTADLLKGVAVLSMILIHLFENIGSQSMESTIYGKIAFFLGGPPAAPLFMIVMGYFLAGSNKSATLQLRRGLILLLGGILLNIGLNFSLLIKILQGTSTLNPLKFIFAVDILPLAGLSIITIALLNPLFKRFAEAYILSAVFVVLFGKLLIDFIPLEEKPFDYIIAFFVGEYEWSYFSLIPWLSFVLVGYSIKLFSDRLGEGFNIKRLYRNVFYVVFGFIFAFTFDYAANITSNLPVYYKFDFLFFLWTLFFLLGFSLLVNDLEIKFSNSIILKYIKWIGINVTSFYVVQWLLIGNISTYFYKKEARIEIMLIWFVAVLVVSTFVVYLWKNYLQKVLQSLSKK
ncbi:MAG: DUF1624 domain-containing protein [Ignavibacteriaceae bacterium]|nr:DUF1624 domain-containing protein [Ignavibacteriaceae bacterium]